MRQYTDEELQAELNRRKAEREDEEEAKKVLVLCPKCKGKKRKRANVDTIYEADVDCSMCKGQGSIKAVRI